MRDADGCGRPPTGALANRRLHVRQRALVVESRHSVPSDDRVDLRLDLVAHVREVEHGDEEDQHGRRRRVRAGGEEGAGEELGCVLIHPIEVVLDHALDETRTARARELSTRQLTRHAERRTSTDSAWLQRLRYIFASCANQDRPSRFQPAPGNQDGTRRSAGMRSQPYAPAMNAPKKLHAVSTGRAGNDDRTAAWTRQSPRPGWHRPRSLGRCASGMSC